MTQFDTLIIVVVPCPTNNCAEHYRTTGKLSSKGDESRKIASILQKNGLEKSAAFTPQDNIYAKFLAENIYSNFTEIEELSDEKFDPFEAYSVISLKLNETIEFSPERKWNATIIVSKNISEKIFSLKEFAPFDPPQTVQPYDIYMFNRSENSLKKVVPQVLS